MSTTTISDLSADLKKQFRKKAIWWAINFHGQWEFIEDDHFNYRETTLDNAEEEIKWIIDYDCETLGSTRFFTDIQVILFHVGNGEYQVYKIINESKLQYIDCATIHAFGVKRFIDYLKNL
ncbi:MAG: hypothetical protein KJI71_01325 [Patescibacteria group bacterium]|nr:hypothetical protein [Patescibacteria group bacterium]